jgi:glutaredoxin
MQRVLRGIAALALALMVTALPAVAADARRIVTVDVFWSAGCPHCHRALAFLDGLAAEQRDLRVRRHELESDPAARRRFVALIERHGLAPAVPTILVGPHVFTGFLEGGSEAPIRAAIAACRAGPCPSLLEDRPRGATEEPALAGGGPDGASPAAPQAPPLPGTVRLPLFGPLDVATLSLPALTVALAAADGFNPCAMWALVFLLGLLMPMRDRRRAWLLGGVFLMVSGLVYWLLLAAWLNLVLLLAGLVWIRLLVAVAAAAAGVHHLSAFAAGPQASCPVTQAAPRRRIMDALGQQAGGARLLAAVAGVALLAVAVNLVEILCSAGLPAIYAAVLAQAPVPPWQRHLLLLLYVLVFMADDVALFAGAMVTLRLTGAGARYAHVARLLGGVVMIALAVLLVWRPDWLGLRPGTG